ncbi:MAG: hypothetical protein AAFO07_10890 [Bacteroidota bacterium]
MNKKLIINVLFISSVVAFISSIALRGVIQNHDLLNGIGFLLFIIAFVWYEAERRKNQSLNE